MRALQDKALIAADVPPEVGTSLDKWADWMRGGNIGRGYPSKSCGVESGGIHTSDDIHEQNDSYAARACDGAIKSLKKSQELAIWSYWIGSSHDHHPAGLHALVVEALPIIHRGLILRGCM